jgi:hypothetical protein
MTKQSASSAKYKASRKPSSSKLFRPSRLPTFLPFATGPATLSTDHEILEHLQDVYGRVSPQVLEDRDNELRSMVYNTQLPINIVFNAVEDYVNFADLANQTLTSSQMIAKAYVILETPSLVENDITSWNHRPKIGKTWESFKTHFRRAHQEFR